MENEQNNIVVTLESLDSLNSNIAKLSKSINSIEKLSTNLSNDINDFRNGITTSISEMENKVTSSIDKLEIQTGYIKDEVAKFRETSENYVKIIAESSKGKVPTMTLIMVIMILGALILSREASRNQTEVEIPNLIKAHPSVSERK